jgi:hypothetical protein
MGEYHLVNSNLRVTNIIQLLVIYYTYTKPVFVLKALFYSALLKIFLLTFFDNMETLSYSNLQMVQLEAIYLLDFGIGTKFSSAMPIHRSKQSLVVI